MASYLLHNSAVSNVVDYSCMTKKAITSCGKSLSKAPDTAGRGVQSLAGIFNRGMFEV
jgi:hypothetical protein